MMTNQNDQNKSQANNNNNNPPQTDALKNLYAPKSVRDFLKDITQNDVSYKSINLALTLCRYQWDTLSQKGCVPYLLKDLVCFLPKKKKKMSPTGKNKASDKVLDKTGLTSAELYPDQMKPLLDTLTTRTQALAQSFPSHITINYKPHFRLLLGSDSDTPYSNIVLLKLHQLYGLPYLSASSLKGSFRSFWILNYFGGSEKAALQDAAYRQLFGAADEDAHVGALVFFDTFPTKFTLTLDIQTPHYPDYYSGSQPPTDTPSPIPIYLLCLQDADFAIPIACQDPVLWQNEQAKIQETFTALLTTYGLGAKTALGYGLGNAKPLS